MRHDRQPNPCVERTGTSRLAQLQLGRLWWLVPAAHARRSAALHVMSCNHKTMKQPLPQRHARSICFVLSLLTIALVGQTSSAGPEGEAPLSAPENPAGETNNCPSPVLPETAFFLGKYVDLELTITANRDGSLQKVVISKRSQARLYDEYTRSWVEKH